MDGQEPGLLGNLPRTRPGQRSHKRDDASATTTQVRGRGRPAATPKTEAAKQAKTGSQPRRAAPPPDGPPGGPLGAVAGLTWRVAATGARSTHGIVRAIVGRLPRP